MDARRFTADAPGQLVSIDHPVQDVAFIPDPLPPVFEPSSEVLRLLPDATEALGRLDGAGKLSANPNLLLRPLRRREALKSSSLEGTISTARALILFELDEEDRGDGSTREVQNYARALDAGLELLDELPWCNRLLREMHRVLLTGVRGGDRRPGSFRDAQVHLGSDRRFVPAPPSELPELLDDFEAAMHARPPEFHPLWWSFLIHYQFETIHPFHDGNGRIGRLLLALMITRECGLSRPWLYMSPWFDRHRDEYIDRLFRVSSQGDWNGWLAFCLRGVVDQANDAFHRLEALIHLQQDYRERVAQSGGAARLHQLLDHLFTVRPVLSTPEARDLTGVTYPTAKADLQRLVDMNILSELPEHRPTLYVASRLLTVGTEEQLIEGSVP